MSVPDFSMLSRDNIVEFLGDIFKRRGAENYLGEDVTMAEHMLQGAELAEAAGARDTMIAGALLHDIGHFTNEFPEDAQYQGIDTKHETAGAAVLDAFFPSSVTDCVRYHVDAKRYLCATDDGYFAQLSEASVHTLGLQGGPMNAVEVADFARNPNLKSILQVRIWDDQGKVQGKVTPGFDHYAPVLQRVVNAHLGAAGT